MIKKIKYWWCNPGRWNQVVVYVALIIWFIGMVLMTRTIQNIAINSVISDKEMAEERANLQSQIDYLDSQMPMRFPEGGP